MATVDNNLYMMLEESRYVLNKNVLYNTKEEWDAQTDLVSVYNTIYVYSDIKKIKNGDGTTLLSSLPYFAEYELAVDGQFPTTQSVYDFFMSLDDGNEMKY